MSCMQQNLCPPLARVLQRHPESCLCGRAGWLCDLFFQDGDTLLFDSVHLTLYIKHFWTVNSFASCVMHWLSSGKVRVSIRAESVLAHIPVCLLAFCWVRSLCGSPSTATQWGSGPEKRGCCWGSCCCCESALWTFSGPLMSGAVCGGGKNYLCVNGRDACGAAGGMPTCTEVIV